MCAMVCELRKPDDFQVESWFIWTDWACASVLSPVFKEVGWTNYKINDRSRIESLTTTAGACPNWDYLFSCVLLTVYFSVSNSFFIQIYLYGWVIYVLRSLILFLLLKKSERGSRWSYEYYVWVLTLYWYIFTEYCFILELARIKKVTSTFSAK